MSILVTVAPGIVVPVYAVPGRLTQTLVPESRFVHWEFNDGLYARNWVNEMPFAEAMPAHVSDE